MSGDPRHEQQEEQRPKPAPNQTIPLYHVQVQGPKLEDGSTRTSKCALRSCCIAIKQGQVDISVLTLPPISDAARNVALRHKHPMMQTAGFIGNSALRFGVSESLMQRCGDAAHSDRVVRVSHQYSLVCESNRL